MTRKRRKRLRMTRTRIITRRIRNNENKRVVLGAWF
jgi:hypothetical protein